MVTTCNVSTVWLICVCTYHVRISITVSYPINQGRMRTDGRQS